MTLAMLNVFLMNVFVSDEHAYWMSVPNSLLVVTGTGFRCETPACPHQRLDA